MQFKAKRLEDFPKICFFVPCDKNNEPIRFAYKKIVVQQNFFDSNIFPKIDWY